MKKKSKIPDRRSRHGREMFLLLLSGVLLFQWGKIDAFAAAKEIKTVNIRVTSKLEVGSKLSGYKTGNDHGFRWRSGSRCKWR